MRIAALLLLVLHGFIVRGQENLSFSSKGSIHTYIYRINADEAWELYDSRMEESDEKYLHTLVDSFITAPPALSPSNYLLVKAIENQISLQLHTVGDLDIKIVNNNYDLSVIVHTIKGQEIEDAKVYIRKNELKYDQISKTYRLSRYRKTGILKIYHNNVLHVFPITNNQSYKPGIFRKIIFGFPLKYISYPIHRILKAYGRQRHNFYHSTQYENKFRGFVAFNKPKYKPGDTVKIKAFITSKSGRPLDKTLLLRLSDRYLDTDTILGEMKPYRDGGYEYSFVLSNDLDLQLDDEYLLTFEETRSRKYNLDDYEGNLDDEDYTAKRKVVVRGKFEYEEYELDAISFIARTDNKEHHRKTKTSVYLKATDENDLAVMDGRVVLVARPVTQNNIIFHDSSVFVPDTIWHHEQDLEAIGETRVIIPDSVFPRASFDYTIECIFLNTNNERQVQTLSQSFKNQMQDIVFEMKDDSLEIRHLNGGIEEPLSARLYGFNRERDTVLQQIISLPARVGLHPFIGSYKIEAESVIENFSLKKQEPDVAILSMRTRDSVIIQLRNPKKLQVWYSIFAGKKMIQKGVGEQLNFSTRVSTRKNYFISVQYNFGDEMHNDEYTIPYRDKLLSINVDQPQFIYPGQSATINIDVKDAEGNAVHGADLTAYAYTAKFKNGKVPVVPYFGKTFRERKYYNNLIEGYFSDNLGTIRLNWERWSREMNLDTIEYYKFLHPQSVYINTGPSKDSITQIAPFVVFNGDIQPIHQIYIDERPVYFSQANHLHRYSFKVEPGMHSFRLRTHIAMITLDSFWVGKGVKTLLSINADTSNKRISIHSMPDTLTNYEKNLWSKYMILIENNFGERYAYTRHNQNIYLLNQGYGRVLSGPYPNLYSRLVVKNGFGQDFEAEGAYLYNISKGLIKQKQLRSPYPFSSALSGNPPAYNFHDMVLAEKEVDSLWQDYLDHRSVNEDLFYNAGLNKINNGRLEIEITKDKKNPYPFIRNIFLFRYDDPDFLRVYKGGTRDFGYLKPGTYRLLFLLKGNSYFIKDSIIIRKDGVNYYETGSIIPKGKDSVSLKISEIINNREKANRHINNYDLEDIKESFNKRYLDPGSFTETISGFIRDDNGNPLNYASVMIKGTNIGVATDANGKFILNAPPEATLVISAIGFKSQEIKSVQYDGLYVALTQQQHSLQEVLVVGYGKMRKSSFTGATTVISNQLHGKVPGVLAVPGSGNRIALRGVKSIKASSGLLIIVDGIPVSAEELDKINESDIVNIKMLNADSAIAIYGSAASDGVIIISTKKYKNPAKLLEDIPFRGNGIRRNFRDHAYWQPRLITDENGRASFRVTFPDDITSWKTFVIAMANKKRTGFAEGSIKSFKNLSASLALPQFAVTGDSINFIGKTMNYSMDSLNVKRSFSVNDVVLKEGFIGLTNSWIDSFAVVVPSLHDSLKLKYTIEKNDGYFDGEERTIPVNRQGVLETTGLFAALDKDTSFGFRLMADTGSIKIYAETSLLNVWESEVEKVRNYEYWCNEQMASKLKVLLVQKKIDGYMGRPFKGESQIKNLVKRLEQNKASSGLWGWWQNTTPSAWISLHVIEALLEAKTQGYSSNINTAALKDYLVYNLESFRGIDKIATIDLLILLDAKADFKKYIDSLDNRKASETLYEKLKVAELKIKAGLPVDVDELVNKQSRTMFGNKYWGEEKIELFDNSVQNTLIMYRILKAKGGYETLLKKVRNYFLEKRRSGQWRNTYESSLILETILPDLLNNNSLPGPSKLVISGSQSKTINTFPFELSIPSGDSLFIHKSGDMPVYFTASQQHWNENPGKVNGDFSVHSYFEQNGEDVTILKAGEPVLLKVRVEVKADADYVMIEVPIPAGCSYKTKNQSYLYNEVHREHFKNKVSIFCSALNKGSYNFSVSLLPRYTGRYTLNPAKAEMMYFPVFYGRDQIRKISIE